MKRGLVFLYILSVLILPLMIRSGSCGVAMYSPSANSGDWKGGFSAYMSDDIRAFAFLDHDKHEYWNYGISIPAGENIDKVEIGPEHYEDAAGRSIGVRVSWDFGTSWSSQAKVFNYFNEQIDWIDATSVTDWTESKLDDSNFLIEVEYFHSSGCFANDVLVTMANGEYETIRGLSKGDKIMRKDGGQQIVTRYEEHDDMPPLLFLNVTVEDGRSVIIHPDHEIVIAQNYTMKLVSELTLNDELLSRDGSMIPIISIGYVMLEDFANIVVSNSLFWAEDLLVHNMVKIPYTAYLDWLPVRITTSAPSACVPCLFIGLLFFGVVFSGVAGAYYLKIRSH